MFEHEAYKKWANYWSRSHDGYIPLTYYDDFFDKDHYACKEAVMLFWAAQCLATANKTFDHLDLTVPFHEDYSSDDCGMNAGSIGYDVDTEADYSEEPDWQFDKCDDYTIEKYPTPEDDKK